MKGEDREKSAPLVEPLTPRELEVLSLLAQQQTNRQIAEALVLSVHTVKWYARQVYGKLGVSSREEAATHGRALGLIPIRATGTATPNNLPAQASPFFGRQRELAKLHALLADPDARLITITGVGGVGKTRLAYAVAERQLARQEPLSGDGVFALSLSPIDNVEQLPAALAHAISFSLEGPEPDGRSAWRQLSGYLQQKRMLLILDNFEHLLPHSKALSRLLRRTKYVQLLVTSRQRLNLLEEHVFPLEGIAAGDWLTVEDARGDPVVQLFLHCARRVRPHFQLGAEDLRSLAHLNQITAGLPLALELAASWVELLPLANIVAEIRHDLDFLHSDLQNVPLRQRSMRAVFESSWRRLEPALQDIFARLSVFRGGFTRGAAREVAGASLTNLAGLSAYSLLHYDAVQDRYVIHELLRQFGADMLRRQTEFDQETRQRHAAYYCRRLYQRERAWFGPEAGDVLAELEREIGNVRQAWRWAVAQRDVQLMAEGLRSLCTYYDRRGFEDQAWELLHAASEPLSWQLVDGEDVACRRLLVRLLTWCSRFSRSMAKGAAALDQGEAHLDGLKQHHVDARPEEAFLNYVRGGLNWDRGDVEASYASFERSLALYLELSDEVGVARATMALGNLAWHRGNYEEAVALGGQALHQQRTLGNRSGVADVLGLLGIVERYLGHLTEAQQAHREAYALQRELGHRAKAAAAARVLAYTLIFSGEFEEAHAMAREGLSLAEEAHSQAQTAHFADAGAWICIHLGRYQEARQYVEHAIVHVRTEGRKLGRGWVQSRAGMVDIALGAYQEAVMHFEEATANLIEAQKSIWMVPRAHQAIALRRLGHLLEARRALGDALHGSSTGREFLTALQALPPAALCIADQGELVRALELYALATHYPHVANSRWYEDVMREDVAVWKEALSPEAVAAAERRGRARDLWQTVAELTNEFGEVREETNDA